LRNLEAREPSMMAVRRRTAGSLHMMDLVYIASIVAFFAASAGLVHFCAGLGRGAK
jgi:hypothetical protein